MTTFLSDLLQHPPLPTAQLPHCRSLGKLPGLSLRGVRLPSGERRGWERQPDTLGGWEPLEDALRGPALLRHLKTTELGCGGGALRQ